MHWKNEPDDHDFPAATAYLSLLFSDAETASIVDALRTAPLTQHKVKDLLRASRLELLPKNNPEVVKDLDKVAHGQKLSPVLVVRGRAATGLPLTVADGYHRICASYHLDENTDVPCRMVEAP